MMMSRVALFLMFFGAALFLSFVKGRSTKGESDGGSGGTKQQDDQQKKEESMARPTVTADNQTDFSPDGACDAFKPLMKFLESNQPALAEFCVVRAFLLEKLNLYIIGLTE